MQGLGRARVDRTQGIDAHTSFAPGITIAKNPSSGVSWRRLDPTIARRIREIDPRLILEWRPAGRWWTGKRPMGASLGCWRICIEGESGEIRGWRMWPPDCADGRLVNFLYSTWARRLFVERSQRYTPATRKQRLEELRVQEIKEKQEKFDKWFNANDHGALKREVQASHESPGWKSNWQVSSKTPGV